MVKGKMFLIGLLIIGFGTSCSDDESENYADSQKPVAQLSVTEVYSEPGRVFHVMGTVTDDVGIAGIQLSNSEFALDKTIAFSRDSLIKNYELDYKFKAPDDASTSQNYMIKVTITDVGGNTTSVDQAINMNGDFDAPALDAPMPDTITVLIKDKTVLNLNFTVTDNKALNYVLVKCDALDIYDSIPVIGKTYNYSKSIPLKSEKGSYGFSIAASDKMNNSTHSTFSAKISDLPDFELIWLTDYLTKESLNAHVVGGAIPAKRVAAYTYEIAYYANKPNKGVFFIPQSTDLQPICFGVDPNNPEKLADDPSICEPITLLEQGYYTIHINTMAGTYSTAKYTPSTTVYGLDLKIGISGIGFPEYPDQNWSPAYSILLEQDKDNPYLLYKELDMLGKVQMTITPLDSRGWWLDPFWRLEQDGSAPLGSGSNGSWEVKNRTKYRFELDTHLQRARILSTK